MKKKFLIFILTVLAALCLCFFSGCALFGDLYTDEQESTDPNPDETDISKLKAPEWVRLDMRWKELYVPDCSEYGVTYYEIIQDYDGFTRTVTSLDTVKTQYPKYEDGCYIIDVHAMTEETSFTFTVLCKGKASDSKGVSNSFEFVEGEGIIYDKDHCTFDAETGLFTWTAVEGAVGYNVGGSYATESKFTVNSTTDSLTITPIYDTNKIGVPLTVHFNGTRADVRYDKENGMFYWDDVADSYIMEIIDGDDTHTFELTETELYYLPDSNYVEVNLTTINALRRPHTTNGTLSFIHAIKSISVDSLTRRVTWTAPIGAQRYNVIITKSDGTSTIKELTYPSFVLDDLSAGIVKVKIQSIGASSWYTSVYTSFDITVIPSVQTFSPSLNYDGEEGKVNLSFDTDPVAVEKYLVSMTADGEDKEVIEVDATEAESFSRQMPLDFYRVYNVSVTRVFKGSADGHYCFLSGTPGADLSKSVMRADAPVVEPVRKTDGINVSRSFTVKVKPHEEFNGEMVAVDFRYGLDARTQWITGDAEVTFSFSALSNLPLLSVKYSEIRKGSVYVTLYTNETTLSVTRLNTAKLTADKDNLSWEEVDGATEYVVEKHNGTGYTTVQTSEDNRYAHGITSPSDSVYRVSAVTDYPLTFNSYTDDFTVTKLNKATVSINSAGTIILSSSSSVTVVSILNGVETAITEANIRAALSANDSVTLEVYTTRENGVNTAYIDGDSDTYTIYKISNVDAASLSLHVDASTSTVSWEEPENGSNSTRLLYRRTSVDEEYVLFKECDESGLLDGSELPYGQYELRIKPESYRDGYNFYIYYGDAGSDTFQKDGIISVGLVDGENLFYIDSSLTSVNGITQKWVFGRPGYVSKYEFDMVDRLDVSQNEDFWKIVSGNNTSDFVLNVDYGDGTDEYLSSSKTLKANGYPLTFRSRESSVRFTGSYEYVERANNNDKVQIKVTLTPDENDTLQFFESYILSYEYDSYLGAQIYDGITIIVDVPIGGNRPQYFSLGKKSDRYIEEDGVFVYYKTTDMSSWGSRYTVTVHDTINPTVTTTGAGKSASKAYFNLHISVSSLSGYPTQENFELEYYSDEGTWETFTFTYSLGGYLYERHDFSFGTYLTADLNCYETAKLEIISGKQIRLRIRWAESTYDGTRVDPSDWNYYTITVPTIA